MHLRTAVVVAITCLALVGPATGGDRAPEQRQTTNIPAQDLGAALESLAEARGLQIVYRAEMVRSVLTAGAKGNLTPEEALEQLLSGTGLRYSPLGDGAVTIVRDSSSRDGAIPAVRPQSAAPLDTEEAHAPPANMLPLAEVKVEARRESLRSRLTVYVTGITDAGANSFDEPLAVWGGPICFTVSGLPRTQGEGVINRLIEIAQESGAPLANQEPCSPNFFVLFTRYPERWLQAAYRRDPTLYDCNAPIPVEEFVGKAQAVRVRYNIDLITSLDPDAIGTFRKLPCSNNSIDPAHTGSRLIFNTVPELKSVLIVIDRRRVQGYSWNTLADYVAMSGLTKLNREGREGDSPTVLNLFNPGASGQPLGLSDWDRAFLKAIYHTDVHVRGQRVAIVEQMLRDVPP